MVWWTVAYITEAIPTEHVIHLSIVYHFTILWAPMYRYTHSHRVTRYIACTDTGEGSFVASSKHVLTIAKVCLRVTEYLSSKKKSLTRN